MEEELILCSTTWKRYDLLNELIHSAETGERKPTKIVIFDNGHKFTHSNPKVEVYRPVGGENLGVSAGDNWFFKNIPGFKIVSNDDVKLFPYTLEMFWQYKDKGDLLVTAGFPILNAFTLFSVNQKVLDTVGYFDESISPRYAYYEDNDYGLRISRAGLCRIDVPTSSWHLGSGTLKGMTHQEQAEHTRKFDLARNNYKAKWGGLPAFETRTPNLYVGYIEHKVEKIQ
jgi:hypothetical protein